LEQSPVEVDLGDDPEALPTRQFPNQTLSPGQILGSRFQIRSLLGRGGMGEVWRAYDLKLRVDVALKTLRAELLEKERALQALRQEVRTAREVMSPNVCRVFDLVELDGQELVSMEYIDGTTLIRILQSRGPLTQSAPTHSRAAPSTVP
jgi:serine/threonine-protein kinase